MLSPVVGSRFPFRIELFLILPLVSLAIGSSAQSPSLDDVHVAPRNGADVVSTEADTLAPRQLPTLDANSKPLRVDVDLVLVPVTVNDAKNRPIMGLGKKDFVLYEAGKPQEIQYFSHEEAPISVGLLLDVSKSMTDKFEMERAAVADFFTNANPQDDYFVVTFSDRPRIAANTTQSIGTIQGKLAMTTPEGNTALLDAISLAVAKMRSAQYKRRALLIISDGGDNHSRYRLKDIKSLVQEADIEIYAIGIFDTALFKTFEEFMGKKWLSEITDATGGRTITVDNLARVPEAAATVSRELRDQYVLGYRPSKIIRDGKWRKITVKVIPPKSQDSLQAFYKKGYVAPGK